MPSVSGDEIAQCVLRVFEALPNKFKPIRRTPTLREWIPLSGIVLSKDGHRLTCVAMGTGMKCLPRSQVQNANGMVLHDCHAEVLALRAFNRFLISECARMAKDDSTVSTYLRRRLESESLGKLIHPFAIQEDVSIHMYCSEAPCGDASMELVMEAQEDSTPWVLPRTEKGEVAISESSDATMKGRGYFSELGIVRRKPARSDAPPTLSKSCTDKLSLKQCTSSLNSTTSLLISPENAYIKSLVLPASQHVPEATTRAFGPSGRMTGITADVVRAWAEGYSFRPFRVQTTSLEFPYSRRTAMQGESLTPCPNCTAYTPSFHEVLHAGVLAGRKQTDHRRASAVCKQSMWKALADMVDGISDQSIVQAVGAESYREFKGHSLLQDRRKVKADVTSILNGWVKNDGDDDFCLFLESSK